MSFCLIFKQIFVEAENNDRFNYTLIVNDVFSKYTYVRALRKKTGSEVSRAFRSILKDNQTLKKSQTDAIK